jgi:hypothetical protein
MTGDIERLTLIQGQVIKLRRLAAEARPRNVSDTLRACQSDRAASARNRPAAVFSEINAHLPFTDPAPASAYPNDGPYDLD